MRESACSCFERLVNGLRGSAECLAAIAGCGVVGQLVAILGVAPARDKLFASAIRVVSILSRFCASVPPALFADNIVATLRSVLRRDGAAEVLTTEQLHDAITLFAELLPCMGLPCAALTSAALPSAMFYLKFTSGRSSAASSGEGRWEWQADGDTWHPYGRRDSARIEAAHQVC